MEFDMDKIFNYSNIAMVVLLGFIWFSWRKFKKSQKDKDAKKFSLSGFFIDDPAHKFEIVATISTVCEVVGLALLAINRGVEPFNAASRYLTVGFVELMFTFMFINTTTEIIRNFMRRIYLDGTVKWWEYIIYPIGFFIMGIPLFIICCIPTYIISNLYFESIGVLKFNYVNDWNPFRYLQPATIDNTYEDDFGVLITIYPELGALILIWFTPLLNIIQLPFAFINIKREEQKKGKEHKEAPKEATMDELISIMDGLFSFVDAKTLTSKLEKLTDKNNKDAYKAIVKGTVTKEAFIEKFRKELLGSDSDPDKLTGVLGYKYVYDQLDIEVKKLQVSTKKHGKLDEDKVKIKTEIAEIEKKKDSGWELNKEKKEDELDKIEKDLLASTNERNKIKTNQRKHEAKMTELKENIKLKLDKTGLIE